MTARIIDGKAIAAELRVKVAAEVKRLSSQHGVTPGLAVVLAGNNPASESYVGSKAKATKEAGMQSFDHRLPDSVSEAELLALVKKLNADPAVHGILVQLPLPKQIDAQQVLDAIDPMKDVDGFHPVNAGRLASGLPALVPCTPLGCVMLAKTVHPSLAGLEAVVIGRSNIVGKPVAQLLLAENATVTITHSKTRDLPAVCRRADLLVAAIGRPEMVRGDWIKPGATVIDVGINRVPGAERQVEARRRRRLRRSVAGRRRDHAGAGRRRADDDRLPDGQHRPRGLRHRRVAGAGGLIEPSRRVGRRRCIRKAMKRFTAAVLVLVAFASQANAQPANSPLAGGTRLASSNKKPGESRAVFNRSIRFSCSRRRRPYRGSFRRTAPRSAPRPCRRAPCRTRPPDRCRTAPRPRGSSARSAPDRGAPR